MTPKYVVATKEDVGKLVINKKFSEEYDIRLHNLLFALKEIVKAPAYISARRLVNIAQNALDYDRFKLVNGGWSQDAAAKKSN